MPHQFKTASAVPHIKQSDSLMATVEEGVEESKTFEIAQDSNEDLIRSQESEDSQQFNIYDQKESPFSKYLAGDQEEGSSNAQK